MTSQTSILTWISLTMRWVLEASIVLSFGFWGYHVAESTSLKLLLAIVVPLIGFGFWGLIDFHQFGRFSEWLRLIQELFISALAALGLYVIGAPNLGYALILLSIVYHISVYLLGERLLKNNDKKNVPLTHDSGKQL